LDIITIKNFFASAEWKLILWFIAPAIVTGLMAASILPRKLRKLRRFSMALAIILWLWVYYRYGLK